MSDNKGERMPITAEDLADALTVNEAATILHLSERHMRRLIAEGNIQIVRPGTKRGRIYITKRALTDYLNRSKGGRR